VNVCVCVAVCVAACACVAVCVAVCVAACVAVYHDAVRQSAELIDCAALQVCVCV